MTITYGTLVDAIEKNGYPQSYQLYVNRGENNKVISACALGQGWLNLKEEYPTEIPNDPMEMFEEDMVVREGTTSEFYYTLDQSFIHEVIALNDVDHLPIQQIVDIIRKNYRELLDVELTKRYWSDWEPSDAQMGY